MYVDSWGGWPDDQQNQEESFDILLPDRAVEPALGFVSDASLASPSFDAFSPEGNIDAPVLQVSR